jgi:hypothetical protein
MRLRPLRLVTCSLILPELSVRVWAQSDSLLPESNSIPGHPPRIDPILCPGGLVEHGSIPPDPLLTERFAQPFAMQKVLGSNPFSRFSECPAPAGLSLRLAQEAVRVRGHFQDSRRFRRDDGDESSLRQVLHRLLLDPRRPQGLRCRLHQAADQEGDGRQADGLVPIRLGVERALLGSVTERISVTEPNSPLRRAFSLRELVYRAQRRLKVARGMPI